MKAKKINEAIKHLPGRSLEKIKAEAKAKRDARRKEDNEKPNFIFRVFSGVDAFVININSKFYDNIGNPHIYLPYIDVIAKSEEQARDKVAAMLDIDIDFQKYTHNDNYISDHVKKIRLF